jgi:formylmethanofuran dehydrogenase subunit C
MQPLTFTLHTEPPRALDCSALTPERLVGLNRVAIGALALPCGNRTVRVDEVFDVTGEDSNEIHFARGSRHLDGIGAGMRAGAIRVSGDVGAYLGRMMRGGSIHVAGHAGVGAAAVLHGGRIEIEGSVGDRLGAPPPGERRGMRGGIVRVRGDAGARVGDRMRRGTIVVEGDAGPYCGARIGAGTIVVLGRTGPSPAFAMRRGTLLLAHAPQDLPATFNDCGAHELLFLRLLASELTALDPRFAGLAETFRRVRRWTGDLGNGGRGEVLVAEG